MRFLCDVDRIVGCKRNERNESIQFENPINWRVINVDYVELNNEIVSAEIILGNGYALRHNNAWSSSIVASRVSI